MDEKIANRGKMPLLFVDDRETDGLKGEAFALC